MVDVVIRPARDEKDIEAIAKIYAKIHDVEEAGIFTIGWERGVYPERETAAAALDRGDLFVYEADGEVLASAIINKQQVDVYENGSWEYEVDDDKIMVLHTLVVDPDAGRKGVGSGFVCYYEEFARENGCLALRIDTNEKNVVARAMYKKLNYKEIGIVPCVFNGIDGVNLVLLEKKL